MCSTNGGQLGRICRAIDELAAGSGGGDAPGGAARDADEGGAARPGDTGPAGRENPDIARLAAIWEMVADADPELAKRLPGYLSATE
jgi:hypothetical protein